MVTRKKPEPLGPRDTSLAELVDRYGDHHTEAVFDRPDRAVTKSLALIAERPNGTDALEPTVRALVASGRLDAARTLLDALLSIRRPSWAIGDAADSWERSEVERHCKLAPSVARCGDGPRAAAIVARALEVDAARRGGAPGIALSSEAMGGAAEALLCLGRDADAGAILRRCSPHRPADNMREVIEEAARGNDTRRLSLLGHGWPVLRALLAHGRLDMFDALIDRAASDPHQGRSESFDLRAARALLDGVAAFDAHLIRTANGLNPARAIWEIGAELVALAGALPARVAQSKDGVEALAVALRDALDRNGAMLASDGRGGRWAIVAGLHHLGVDIAPFIDDSLDAQERAVAFRYVFPVCPALRPRLLAWAAGFDIVDFPPDRVWSVGLYRQVGELTLASGERDLGARMLMDAARVSRKRGGELGHIAARLALAGLWTQAEETLSLATKAKRSDAVASLRAELARYGDLAAYAGVVELPDATFGAHRARDLVELIEAMRRAAR